MGTPRLVKVPQDYAQIPYLQYGVSQVLSVAGGATPVAIASNTIAYSCILIQPSVDIRFKISKAGTDAGSSDPIAWARRDTYIGFSAGSKISVIKENGEADGQVVVTPLEEV